MMININELCQTSIFNLYNRVAKNLFDQKKQLLPIIHINPDHKKIIYSLHGYMGAPYEMNFLTKDLDIKDFSIFHDLILGYGNHPGVANKISKEEFLEYAYKNLEFVFQNFSEIHLAGFSTGGLIITKFLVDHPEYHHKLKSLHLISPFYLPYSSLLPKLNRFLIKKVELLDVKILHKITRFPDVKIILLEPDFYLQKIPLKGAMEIESLANQLVSQMQQLKPINSYIYLTKKDKVLSCRKTIPFIKKYFNDKNLYIFNEKKSPHHLLHPLVSNQSKIIVENFTREINH